MSSIFLQNKNRNQNSKKYQVLVAVVLYKITFLRFPQPHFITFLRFYARFSAKSSRFKGFLPLQRLLQSSKRLHEHASWAGDVNTLEAFA